MPRTLLTPVACAAACLIASPGYAAIYDVTADASARFILELGYLQGQEIAYIDPFDGAIYYDDVFYAGQEFVTINSVFTADGTFQESFGARAQTSSDPTGLNDTDSGTYTFEVTNTHPELTVQEMSFDISANIEINGGLSSDLVGYTQVDGNAFVSGTGLSNAFASIFEEINCTAANSPCNIGDTSANFSFGSGNFTLAAGETMIFSYTASASTTVILPDAPAVVPLPASGLLLGAVLLVSGLGRRRRV